MLTDLAFPLDFTFRVLALAPQFAVTDAHGEEVAYTRQKLFRLREAVQVYRDASRDELTYTLRADRWLDFSASYEMADAGGRTLGRVARHGLRSLWKARFDVLDADDGLEFTVRERSVVTRWLDNKLGDIPVLGLLTGYLFHPVYDLRRPDGTHAATFTKRASWVGRRFRLTSDAALAPDEQARIVLALMMMVLLERERG